MHMSSMDRSALLHRPQFASKSSFRSSKVHRVVDGRVWYSALSRESPKELVDHPLIAIAVCS